MNLRMKGLYGHGVIFVVTDILAGTIIPNVGSPKIWISLVKISGADPTPQRVYNECVNQCRASNKLTSKRVTTCFVIYNNGAVFY